MSGFELKDPKTPFSRHYDDYYFANEHGVEESRYVYLEGAGVLEAIANRNSNLKIGEVGFGVGLNFLLTLRAFLDTANSEQTLEYWSVEKYPVSLPELRRLYQSYPDLLPTAELLFSIYPVLTPGVHRLTLFNRRVQLNLLIGDVHELFPQLNFRVDHWYWDGFAPQKNPDAFSPELFQEVIRLSAPGAIGASFTAAGWVRRGMEACGYRVEKRRGYGTKRECIRAVHLGNGEASPRNKKPWFSRENICTLKKDESVVVLGAGLAGSAIARNLADRGYRVRVFDRNGIAERASSNSVGLYNVQLSKLPNPISRFSQAALTHFLTELKSLNIPFHAGILRKEEHTKESLLSSGYPDDFYELREGSVYFPECGIINPRTLCLTRLNHPLIEFKKAELISIESAGLKKTLHFRDGSELECQHFVYALGADSNLSENVWVHPLLAALPFRSIRGQTLLVKPNELSKALPCTLVQEGYASPLAPHVTGHELHLLGATYQAKTIAENQVELDEKKLLSEAKEKWPEFAKLSPADVVSHKVGFRSSTPDKLPVIGPLCDPERLKTDYQQAFRGSTPASLPIHEPSPGEWLMMGLGSRGITFSSLGAEILADWMTGSAFPLEQDLIETLHPARFALRSLRKTQA